MEVNMEVNVDSFKNVLLKSTLNYSVDNVGFTVIDDRIKCGMTGENFVIILNMENDLIPDIKGECDFFFSEPNNQIRTHLDLLSGSEKVTIGITDNNISLKAGSQQSLVHFCSPNLVRTFSGDGPKIKGDTIYEVQLSDDWLFKLDKIQKIASKFKKLYFVVRDGRLYVEATDKLNSYSNGLSLALGRCDQDDMIICFDFKAFVNAFKVFGEDYEDFKMKLMYIEDREVGMISFINNDESEKYYILSKEDTE